ncbi:MAG TPA: hypothetical protein VFV05_03925 [Methylomirabilota bacterium]|nr:hypothetical protein [Methylomirabilota bacterium]
MARFEDYATKYQTVRMERRDGILQMTFHTDGGPLQWGLLPHGEFPQAFRDVGSDPENKVVILTGTGETYSGPRVAGGTGMRSTPAQWDRVYWEGKHLLMSLLDIEAGRWPSSSRGNPRSSSATRACSSPSPSSASSSTTWATASRWKA